MSKPDGGPAFPRPHTPGQKSDIEHGVRFMEAVPATGGMSLRDYFAAAALQGILTNGAGGWDSYQQRAESAYHHADAMLAERDK